MEDKLTDGTRKPGSIFTNRHEPTAGPQVVTGIKPPAAEEVSATKEEKPKLHLTAIEQIGRVDNVAVNNRFEINFGKLGKLFDVEDYAALSLRVRSYELIRSGLYVKFWESQGGLVNKMFTTSNYYTPRIRITQYNIRGESIGVYLDKVFALPVLSSMEGNTEGETQPLCLEYFFANP